MFQDDERVLTELKQFKKKYSNEFSEELNEAVTLSIALLEVQVNLANSEDSVYLGDDDFRRYYNSCKDILNTIKDDDSGTFDEWAKIIASENLAYACSLYSENPNVSAEMQLYLFDRTKKYGEVCISLIDKLERITNSFENNDSIGLIAVFKAYIYRHLFIANRERDKSEADKWLRLTVNERRQLVRTFDDNSVDSKLFSNFEMEYYLSLMEYIDYVGKDSIEPFEYLMFVKDIDDYISKVSKGDHIHAFVKQIENKRKTL